MRRDVKREQSEDRFRSVCGGLLSELEIYERGHAFCVRPWELRGSAAEEAGLVRKTQKLNNADEIEIITPRR